jgi:hypothetical protein
LSNLWLRQHLLNAVDVYGLVVLIASDTQNDGAVIDGVSVPKGAGSKEFARIPSIWFELIKKDTDNAVDMNKNEQLIQQG